MKSNPSSSSDMSSLSNATTDINVHEQAYVFPRGIRTLSPTSTSYGISVKDLIGEPPYCSHEPSAHALCSCQRKWPDSVLPSPFP